MDTSLAGGHVCLQTCSRGGPCTPSRCTKTGKERSLHAWEQQDGSATVLAVVSWPELDPMNTNRKRSLMPTSWPLTSPRAQCHSHIRAWAMIKPNLNIHTFLSHFLGLAWASVHSCDSHIVPSLSHKQKIWSCAFTREDWSLTPLSVVIAGKQEQKWIPSSPQVVTAHSTC